MGIIGVVLCSLTVIGIPIAVILLPTMYEVVVEDA
jgi:hypothetical protein